MLKVSLLPESYKKQIIGSKKKDAIKRVALVVLVMVLAMMAVVMGTRQFVVGKLNEVTRLNQSTIAKFPLLSEYETLYAEVLSQRELIDSVVAKEPYAQDFVVSLGNISIPSLWITDISAEDWFYTKKGTVNGSCLSYDTLKEYMARISELEGILSVTINSFELASETTANEERIYNFSLAISVDGLGTPYVVPTLVEEVGTTVVDENAGVED